MQTAQLFDINSIYLQIEAWVLLLGLLEYEKLETI